VDQLKVESVTSTTIAFILLLPETGTSYSKVDCPNPAAAREFTRTCRICEQQGRCVADCPARPPEICKSCQEEGHGAIKCENPQAPPSHFDESRTYHICKQQGHRAADCPTQPPEYYDVNLEFRASEQTRKFSFAYHCKLILPKNSPLSSLQMSPNFAGTTNGSLSYETVATQTRCCPGINIHEFLSFQALFSGKLGDSIKF
jgi:hypothetical protein